MSSLGRELVCCAWMIVFMKCCCMEFACACNYIPWCKTDSYVICDQHWSNSWLMFYWQVSLARTLKLVDFAFVLRNSHSCFAFTRVFIRKRWSTTTAELNFSWYKILDGKISNDCYPFKSTIDLKLICFQQALSTTLYIASKTRRSKLQSTSRNILSPLLTCVHSCCCCYCSQNENTVSVKENNECPSLFSRHHPHRRHRHRHRHRYRCDAIPWCCCD